MRRRQDSVCTFTVIVLRSDRFKFVTYVFRCEFDVLERTTAYMDFAGSRPNENAIITNKIDGFSAKPETTSNGTRVPFCRDKNYVLAEIFEMQHTQNISIEKNKINCCNIRNIFTNLK